MFLTLFIDTSPWLINGAVDTGHKFVVGVIDIDSLSDKCDAFAIKKSSTVDA
jgi:hypothetical protein